MFEVFEHTADVGIRVRADDLPGLFCDAAKALFSVIVVNLDQVRPVEEAAFRVEGRQHDELLHDWLDELLFTFATRHLLFCEFHVELGDGGLSAIARGEPVDTARHELDSEVKAITYHGLQVEALPDGWTAEVILDL